MQASKSSVEIIHDAVKERYDFEIDRIKLLDNKASNIMSIAGILATLVTGFASLAITFAQFNALKIIAIVAFAATLVLLIASFCFGLRAHQIRSYVIVPDPPILVIDGAKLNATTLLQVLGDTYTLAVEKNMMKNEEKVFNIQTANWLVLVGVVLFAIFAFFAIAGKEVIV